MGWLGKVFGRKEKLDAGAPPSDRGAVHLDFERTFPHVFWTSDWAELPTEPGREVRHKILSVRDEVANSVSFVHLCESRDGSKEEFLRGEASVEQFDSDADFISMFELWGVSFDRIDMRNVKSFEDFEEHARRLGWDVC